MAFTKLQITHPESGEVRSAPVGVSWTVFFFGFIPPLLRGDYKWGLIMLALWVLSAGVLASWLIHIVFMFIYNKLYIKEMIAEGYVVTQMDESLEQKVVDKLGFKLPRG